MKNNNNMSKISTMISGDKTVHYRNKVFNVPSLYTSGSETKAGWKWTNGELFNPSTDIKDILMSELTLTKNKIIKMNNSIKMKLLIFIPDVRINNISNMSKRNTLWVIKLGRGNRELFVDIIDKHSGKDKEDFKNEIIRLFKKLYEKCEDIHSKLTEQYNTINDRINSIIEDTNPEDIEEEIKKDIKSLNNFIIYDFMPARMRMSENDNPIHDGYIIQQCYSTINEHKIKIYKI